VKHCFRTTFATFLGACAFSLALGAPAAIASYGHGFYGEVDDTVVTLAGFCVIGFFTVFVIVMSLIQGLLDRRKETRKAAHAALGDGRWRGGW
jgi:hypothetical protein